MKKKVLAMMLSLTMTAMMFAGCEQNAGANTATGLNNTDKVDDALKNAQNVADSNGYVYTGEGPVTSEGGKIKILAQTSNYPNVEIEKAPIVLKVFEEAGVEPEWELLNYDSYETEAPKIISSAKTDADIIKIPDSDPNQVYIKSGLFVPLDEYFDYMPNFTKWLSENAVEKAELTAEDGHIYYVPGINVADDYQPCLMYNQVWLDKAGIKAPDTLDEFVEML